MKRRVQREKETKRALRQLHAARDVKPPYTVLVDASFIRTAHDAKVENVAALVTSSFGAPCTVHYNAATDAVLCRTAMPARPLLADIERWNLGPDDKRSNERKAIVAVVKSVTSVVFVGTQSHDLRRDLAKVPHVVLTRFSPSEKAVRIDTDTSAATSAAAPQTSAEPAAGAAIAPPPGTGLSERDSAFIRKLAAEKAINLNPRLEKKLAQRPTKPDAAAATAVTDDAEAAKKKRSKARKAQGANPLSSKKRASKPRFVSADYGK